MLIKQEKEIRKRVKLTKLKKIIPYKCYKYKKKRNITKKWPENTSSDSNAKENKREKKKKKEKTKRKALIYFVWETKPIITEIVKSNLRWKT